jgi:maltokinase
MHVAMAEAFGRRPAEPGRWADELAVDLERVPAAGAEGLDREAVARAFERLRRLQDAGAGIRLHGDYHLGQTMRTDTGWYVLDFEGEPARPLEERSRPSSPLRDVAGMLRSFQYASRVALIEQGGDDDPELVDLARAWERLNREAFLDGYHRAPGVEALLPEAEASRAAVLTAFELGKAVYEVGYELAMRPGWARIPLEAAQRLLEEA